MSKRLIGMSIVVALCVGVVLLLTRGGGIDCDGYRFDAASWRRAHAGGAGQTDAEPAHRLAGELAECRTLTGKDKQDVERLLGRPVASPSTRDAWHYDLGDPDGTFAYDTLVVQFAGGRRVVGVDIWHGG